MVTSTIKVIDLRTSNPCATLEQIANDVGITSERVRQILKKANLPTKHYIRRKHCLNCGKELQNVNKTGFCFRCWNQSKWIPLVCDECGILFWRLQSGVISHSKDPRYKGHIFCTRKCFGSYISKHFGFGVHPENADPHKRYNELEL